MFDLINSFYVMLHHLHVFVFLYVEILEMPSLSSKQNVKCGMLPPKMKVMKQTTLRG